MANSIFRVGGSYTTINFKGSPIAYVDVIRETGPQPVARPQAIQPIDSKYPIEIAFPMAIQAGTLDIQIRETWNAEVWAQLGAGYSGSEDLIGIYQANLNNGPVTCTKVINIPGGGQRGIIYHGCVVTNIQMDETVAIDTMSIPKTITIMYLQRTSLAATGNNSPYNNSLPGGNVVRAV